MNIKKELSANYRKRKNILDLKKLEKYKIKKQHLIFLLIICILFLLSKRYFVFIFITAFSAVFNFYHSKINRTPVDFRLALFPALYITREFGMLFTFVFYLISDLTPALIGGDSLQGPDLFFISWYFIINSVVYLFPTTSLTILGPILVLFESFGSTVINKVIAGIPGLVSILASIMMVIVRIIYFLILGPVIELLFKVIN